VPVSLQDVVADAMNRVVASALSKDIALEDKVPGVKVMADAQLLARVVTILLDNAIKYSHDKSKITLRASAKGGYGYLEVKDRGIGIRATDLPHIFDRFYRADRSRSKERTEGYGLGLSIAQKIVEQHHGEILVKSQQDSGSTFTIKLPLAS
jgi:signal transduction histidine kinase